MVVVVSLSQGRTAAVQYGLFTHKSVPVIFEPPCMSVRSFLCFTNMIFVTESSADKTGVDWGWGWEAVKIISPDYVAFLFGFLGSHIFCRLHKLTLSDQDQVARQMTVSQI